MEILTTTDVTFEEIKNEEVKIEKIEQSQKNQSTSKEKATPQTKRGETIKRPETVNAKVYKLKSRFVKESLYVTLSYVEDENNKKRPIEIFINSKDLSRLPEYTVLTRLISAIFRNFNSPEFLLEELQSIYDPNGGYFMKGKYIYSFYSEIAMIIERFFIDIGFISQKDDSLANWIESAKKANPDKKIEVNNFKICPQCNQKSLQIDGGCLNCINPECGYSKCS
ncbi:MAG: hypothetical protein ACOC16_03755 [Nanoarchaeota archaeon]